MYVMKKIIPKTTKVKKSYLVYGGLSMLLIEKIKSYYFPVILLKTSNNLKYKYENYFL